MSERTIRLLMVLTAAFWSGAFITGKIAVSEFPPFSLTFFRFLLAVPFIFLILYRMEPEKIWPSLKQWKPLFILGLIGTFGYHALFFTALQYTTAINSSLIGALNPMVTTFLAALFFQEKLTFFRLVGIVLSLSGVFLVVTKANWQVLTGFHFNFGDLMMLLAVFCWAVYSLLGRVYMKKYQISPLMATAYSFLICVILSFPVVCWENPLIYWKETTLAGWLSILYMSIFASVIGYLVQLLAIQKIGASRAATFINLVPLFTIIQSVIILGETIAIVTLVGAVIIISGVSLATRSTVKA